MANYQEVRVKLNNVQLKKLKSVAKNKTETILRLSKKNFEDEELPHELFLATKQFIKSLEDSGVLIDGVTESVKHETKNKKVDFLELC